MLTSVGPWQPVQAPRLTFSRVAGLIHKGELQAWRLPIPADPPTTYAAGSGAEAMRSQTTTAMAPATSFETGTPLPKGVATEALGQDAANLQCQGDPVAPASGEEILILQDFSVRAPMPLVWQRWYRSRNSDRDLGIGAGWFAECLRLIWQDDDATWLLDHEARPVRMPLLALGEIAWQAVGGQRLERKKDDRMMLTERDGRVWVLVPDNRGSWRPTSVQDAAGHQWLFFYDARQRLWRLDFSPHRRLQFSYGEDDLLRQVSLHSGDLDQDESLGQELVVYEYDRHANLIAATTSTGTERYSYHGNLLASRELPSGYRFLFHWDGIGPQARCLRTHGEEGRYDFHFDYQPDRLLTRVTDAFGNEQVFHYDDQGRIVARQDPDGGTHQWQYNHRGQLLAYRLPDGRTTQYSFDAQGHPVLVRLPDGREHRRVFNVLGFCTGERLPDGRQLQRKFDLLGRVLREQRADGSHWQYHYDDNGWLSEACSDAGEVHRTGFDAEGHLLAHEERGALNRYVFDEQGRLTGHLNQDLITEYQYEGSHLSAIHQYPEQAPHQRQSRHYRYDSAGRLTDFTTATGESHGYDYDGLARPIRYRRPDGKAVEYQYDKAQRLTDVIRADGSQWALSYNSKGEISACEAPDGRRITFRYDAAGDIVHREQGADWVQHLKRDAGGRVVQQSSQGRDRVPVTKQCYYDRFGRRTGASCADRRLQWQYDAQGRVTQHRQDEHTIGYHYGPGPRLDSLQLPDGTTISYTYSRQGRWKTLSVNGETHLQRQFDDQGREQVCEAGRNRRTQVWDRHNRLITRRWQGQTTCVRRYSWDAESRLEQYTDSKDGTRQFHRDPQGQLIADAEQTFQYDDGGNRITDETRIQQDRLLENGTTKRRYDTLGAEVEVRGPQIQQRRFDAEGQLVDLKQAGGLPVQYGYDALGRRAWRRSENGTTTYLWHHDVLLGEQSPNGEWQWYIRDPQTDAPLLTLIQGQPYYYELDWRGMPIRLWADDGSLVWQARADAWGRCQSEGKVHQPIRLPGQFEDELTGLHFNRFRDYDPATGRYLTPDPLGLKGGLNSYRYTPNPVDYVDPLGLDFTPVVTASNADQGEDAAIPKDTPSLSALDHTAGAIRGAGKVVWESVEGMVSLVVYAHKLSAFSYIREQVSGSYTGFSDTANATKETANFIAENPGKALDGMVAGVTEPYEEAMARGETGEAIGRGVADVGSIFFAPAKAAQAATVTAKTTRVARRAYLNEKYGRIGNLNTDINIRGELNTHYSSPSRLRGIASPKRPGGYQVQDADAHGNLSPGRNRAPGHKNEVSDNLIQSHHAIQHEWAKLNVPGYKKSEAPGVLLPSSSGMSHANISSAQRTRRGAEGFDASIEYEFNTSYREMIDAGVPENVTRKAINQSYKYYDKLGAFQ